MRILHVNLAKGFRGGERQTELLIRALSRQGLQQFIICRSDSPLRERLASTHELQFIVANHQLMGHRGIPQIDIIQAHEAKAVHWAWLQSCLKATPYVITRRVTHPVRDTTLNRMTYSKAAGVIAISSPIESHLKARGGCRNLTIIPDMLAYLPRSESLIAELRDKYCGKFLIGHAGSAIDQHKGQREIIKAARVLAHDMPNALFLMLGDGPDLASFRRESADLPNIQWLGFKDNLGDYLALLDVFLFPSRHEGLGSVLLDAIFVSTMIAETGAEESNIVAKALPQQEPRHFAESMLRIFWATCILTTTSIY